MTMADEAGAGWRVPVGERETTAVHDAAASADGRRVVFVCAHGAGGHRGDGAMLKLRDALVARGIELVRYNFFYKEKGSGRPDPMPLLQECTSAEVARAGEELRPDVLVIG